MAFQIYMIKLLGRIPVLIFASISIFCSVNLHAANNLPEQFVEETILSGLTDPVNITTMPDGRMLVLEKIGRVKLFDPSSVPTTASIILGIGAIQSANERGLASIALDPNFASNGYFYLYYTQLGNDNRNRISRYTFDFAQDQVTGPEVLVWEDNEPAIDCCHYGGGMDFGPDGMLYLATGEEFDAPQAQDLTRAGGKVIRLDVSEIDANGPWIRGSLNDHIIPDDNPVEIMDGAGPNLDEIWAYGIRNPFRAHWDLVANKFYMGEVGGNVQATATEDLHVGMKGANYGWPICEGSCNNPLYDDPVYFYGHEGATPAGGAIVAGTSYYSDVFPSEYYGAFFIADYALGFIKYLKFDSNGDFVSEHEFATDAGALVALEQGPDGALYAVDYVGERVIRYSYDSGNQRPEITSVTTSAVSGPAPLTVNFAVSATDEENDPLTYHWFFGDGAEAFGANVTHTYTANGFNNVFVVVNDGDGSVTSTPIEIQVGIPPVATINFPADGTIFRAGETVPFSGDVTDPDENLGHSFEWDIDFFHNAHIHPGITEIGTSGSLYIETTGHDYHDDTGYEINLIVTDSDGLTGTTSVRIYPDKVDLNLSTQPAGFSITVDGLPISTPIAYDTIVDFNHVVSVPESVCSNGIQYDFDNWSNGGDRTQLLVVPASDTNLVANFTEAGSCNIFPTGGLVAHYESDQGVETTGDTASSGEDPIIAWNDLSGNGNHFNFVGGDPGLLPSALNGNPAVVFDGFEDVLRRDGFIEGFPGGSQDRTVFLVTSYDSSGAGGFAFGKSFPNNLFGLHIDDNGFYRINAFGVENDQVSNTLGTGGGWGIQSAVVDSNVLTHYLNGAVIDTAAHVFDTDVQSLVLGADHDNDPHVAMKVTALMVYDRALDQQELLEVEEYLQDKYFTINGNRIPVAATDEAGVDNGGTTVINVAANDTDDGSLDLTSVTIVQMPSGGTASVNPVNGEITYTHGGIVRTDTLRYTIDDDAGITSNIGVVEIELTSPGDLLTSGLVAQYETDNGVNTTGDLVLGWDDISGSGNSLSTFGNPRILPNVLGDLPAIQLDGIGDKLERIGNVSGFPAGNDDRTVFLVVNYLSPGYGGFSYGEALFNQSFGLVADNTPTGQLTVQGWGLGNDFPTQFDGVGPDDGWIVQSATLDSGTLRHYENGQLIDIRNHEYNTSTNRIVLGSEIDGAPFVNMLVGAALVYDRALTPTEQQTVLNYLEIKYKLEEANDEPPLAVDDRRTIATGDVVSIDILSNDSDNGFLDPATIEIIDQPSGGSISLNSLSGVLTYTHDGVSEGDVFSYRAADNIGQYSNVADIVINIGTPATLPTEDLVAHYQADSGVNLFTNGQVSSWETGIFEFSGNDLSGNGGGVYGGPKYVPNALNGLPIIRFDGEDDALAKIGLLSGFQEQWFDRSIYMLASYKSAGGGLTYGQQTRDRAFGITVKENGNFRFRSWGGTGDVDSGVPGVNVGWVVQGAVYDDFVLSHTINGEEISRYEYVYRTEFGLNGDAEFVIGADMDFAPFVEMDIAEILIYRRALSPEEQEEVHTYLDNKWNFSNAGIPVAEDDSFELFSGDESVLALLENDVDDIQLDPTSVTIVENPQFGTIQIDSVNGDITYTHDGSENSDSFSYSVADNLGVRSNVANVDIAIDNDASPIAFDDVASVAFNGSVSVDVLANDLDDGVLDVNSVSVVAQPQGGLLSISNGQIQYQHGGLVASDSFTYVVLDDVGQLSNIASVSIELSSPGSVPVQGLVAHFESDFGVNFDGTEIVSWTDQSGMGNHLNAQGNPNLKENALGGLPAISLDGQTDRFEILSGLNGFPTGDAPRSVYFLARYNGPGYGGLSFGQPSDNQTFGLISSNIGRYGVQGWGAGNDFISGQSATQTGWAVQSASVFPGSVIHSINGQQIDARGHTYNTADGALVVGAEIDGSPQLDMDIAAILVYDRVLTATEGQLVENYLALKYRPDIANNERPIAVNDRLRVADSSVGYVAVIENDQDDGTLDPATVNIVSQPLNGAAVVNPVTGVIEYTHGGVGLSDTFSYTVSDDIGLVSNEAIVTIAIGDPIALPTTGLVAHFEADRLVNVVNNVATSWLDLTPSGNDMTATGGVTVLPDALNNHDVLQFNGLAGYMEHEGALIDFPWGNEDRSIYLVASYESVGSGGFAYGQHYKNRTFGLHVEDSGLLRVVGHGPQYDFVSDTVGTGAGWIVQSVNLNNGQIEHSVNGETIDSGYNVFDTLPGSFILGADLDKDPSVQMKVAALLIYNRSLDPLEQQSVFAYIDEKYNVISAGRPVANSDIAAVSRSGSVAIDVASNDIDDDGFIDPSTVTLVRDPLVGTAVIDPANGSVSYTHSGTGDSDTFAYTIADNQGRVSVEATVAIFVDEDLDPFAGDDYVEIASGAETIVDVLTNDSDDFGIEVDSITIVDQPLNGTVVVNSVNGSIVYTHNSLGSGDSFTYTVTDGSGQVSNVATVSIDINAPGPLPEGGLVLHLESTDGVTLSNGFVTDWADQSGNGNNLIAAGDPVIVENALNGLPVLDFDGVDDHMERLGGLVNIPTGSDDRSVFLLAKYRGRGYGGFAWGTPESNRVFGTIVDATGRLAIQGWGASNDFGSAAVGSNSTWIVQSAVLNNNQLTHRLDGASVGSYAHAFNTSDSFMRLGAEIDNEPSIDMQVAAVLVYDRALSAFERAQIENYFEIKYKLALANDNPPVAANDSVVINNGNSAVVSVLANDSDDGGIDATSINIVEGPSNGTVEVNTVTGVVTYTTAGPTTGDEFKYTVLDSVGQVSNEATVTIAIFPSGLVAHYEADTFVEQAEGAVTVWRDQSGKGNDLTGSGNVQLLSNKLNGLPVIDFDGDGDALTRNGGIDGLPVGAQDRSVFMVVNYEGLGSGGFAYGQHYKNRTFGLHVEEGGLLRVVGHGPQFDFVTNTAGTSAGWIVQSVDVSNNTVTHSVDGVLTDSFTRNYDTLLGPTGAIVLGADLDESPHVIMQVAAIMVFDRALTPIEQVGIQTYLENKYNVNGIGSPQVADDEGTLVTGGTLVLDVLSNDVPVAGVIDPATVQIVEAPEFGTAMVDAVTGEIIYVHDGGSSRLDSFTYVVANNDSRLSDTATVLLTIDDDLSPIAFDDEVLINTGATVSIAPLLNDTDDNALDVSSLQLVSYPEGGIATVDTNTGEINYVHDGSSASDSFSYRVLDFSGQVSNLATVFVEVDTPDSLLASNLVLHLDSTIGVVESNGVISSWVDQSGNGNDLTAVGDPTLVTDSLNGISVVDFDGVGDRLERLGVLTSMPTGQNDRTVFLVANYRGRGWGGFAWGDPSTNNAYGPIVNFLGQLTVQGWGAGNDQESNTVGMGAGWLVQSTVLSNNTSSHFVDGELLTSESHAYATSSGRIVLGAGLAGSPAIDMQVAAVFVYDRALNEVERQQVTNYIEAKYAVSVANDDVPVAIDDTLVLPSGSTAVVSVLNNDSDDTGLDASSVQLVQQPSNGTAIVNPVTGVITYTHSGVGLGDEFTYTVLDEVGQVSNQAVIRIENLPGGMTAHFEADSLVEQVGGSVSSWGDQSLSGNHLTASGDVQLLPNALNGHPVLDFDGNGDVFIRETNINGIPVGSDDRSIYLVVKYEGLGSGGFAYGQHSANNTFGLHIENSGLLRVVGHGPQYDFVSNAEGTDAGWIIQSVVLENNTSTHAMDGAVIDAYTHTYNTLPGPLVLGADLDVDPYVDMQVAALFVYDRALSSAEQTEILTYLENKYDVTGAGAPQASEDEAMLFTGVTVSIPVLANDVALDGVLDASTVVVVSPAAFGTTTVNQATGEITYSHSGVAGTSDYFTYTVANDEGLVSDETTVRLIIDDEPPPFTFDDLAIVDELGTVDIDVLANDVDDVQIDTTSVVIESFPTEGVVTVNPITGIVSYTHSGGAAISDSFSYTVDDNSGQTSEPATVNIGIAGLDKVPVTADDLVTIAPGDSIEISVLLNDSDDVGLNPDSIELVELPQNGSVIVGGSGTVSYTHGNVNLGDEFTYIVKDTLGQISNEATVRIFTLPSGMVAFYDSDARVSQANGLVTGWGDLSDQGNDLTARGDVQVVQNTLNGRPVIDFDGVGDALVRLADIDGMPLFAQDRSVYMVVNYEGLGSGGFAYGQHFKNRTFGLHVDDVGLLRVNGHGPENDYVSDVTATGAGWLVQSVIVSDNNAVHAIDGVPIDTYTHAYSTVLGEAGKLVLGADLDEDPHVDMQVATVMIFDRALSLTEQSEVQAYLQSRYNVTETGRPVATNDSYVTLPDTSALLDVLENDIDDGSLDPSSLQIVSPPTGGTAVVDNLTGEITYTHDGVSDSDSFTYTVADELLRLSNTATVDLTVGNAPPVAGADDVEVASAGGSVSIDVISNDTTDGTLDLSTLTIVAGPTSGTVEIDFSTGNVTYTHNGNASAVDSFSYTIADELGTMSNLATVTIQIVENDSAPVAQDDYVRIEPGASIDVTVLVNDFDDVGLDVASVVIVGSPQNGVATVNPTGTISYTHANVVPDDEFTYSVMDTFGQVSNVATVEVSTLPTGLVAHYESDALVTQDNGLVTAWGDLSGQGNDLTATGDVQILSNALSGRDVLDFDGVGDALVRGEDINGMPLGSQDRSVYMVVNYKGLGSGGFAYGQHFKNRTFGLHVEDGGFLRVNGHGPQNDFVSTTTGTGSGWIVQSVVLSNNSALHAVDGVPIDSYTHTYDTMLGTTGGFVLGADLDEDPHVEMQVAALLVFDRALDSSEQANVQTYLQNNYQVVSVGSPVAFDDSFLTLPGASTTFDVLNNDTDDVALDPTSVQIVNAPTGGFATVDSQTGEIVYTHDGVSIEDSFTYSVADDLSRISNVATVIVALGNPPPVANDDGALIAEAGDSIALEVLSNDTTDGTLDASTLIVVSGPTSGTADINSATGVITYTHDAGTSAVDSFTYTIADDQGTTSNTASVTISIGGNNAPPVAENDFARVEPGNSVDIDVLSNDSDDLGFNASSIVILEAPQNGVAVVNPTGFITYTHDSSNLGDEFSYSVQDTFGQVSNVASVRVSTLPSGLVAHFESSALVMQNGGTIATWGDLSDEGNDLTATGDVQLLPNALNGHPVVDFDGTNDALVRAADINGMPLGALDRSVYMVVKYDGIGSGGFAYGQHYKNRTFGLHVEEAGLLRVNGHGPQNDYVSSVVGTGAGWIVQSAVLESNSVVHAVDGIPVDTYSHTYSTLLGPTGKFVLGADLDESPHVDMQVAALLVFNRALSTTEQGAVQNYLQTTYGVSLLGTPVAFDDSGIVPPGASAVIDVLANDIDDVALDQSSVQIISGPTGGTALVDPLTGNVVYSHDGVSVGDSFTYSVADDLMRVSNTATVSISLGNPPPVANDDSAEIAIVGGGQSIEVLSNDLTDGSLELSTLAIVDGPSFGSVDVNGLIGEILYTHDGGISAVDSFSYTISDDQGLVSNVATVSISISANDAAPIAQDVFVQVEPGGSVDIVALANDTDDFGLDVSSVAVVGTPQNGTAIPNVSGTITYTHNNQNPDDQFSYTVLDTLGQVSNEATVRVYTLPSGLVAHYESSALVSQSGGSITTWGDISGQGNDLMAEGDVQLLPGSLNGQPVVDFDGTDDALVRLAGINGLPLGAQDRSVYMVVNYEGIGSGGFAYGEHFKNRTFGLHVEEGGFLRVNGHGPQNDFVSTTMGTGAGWIVQSAILTSNNSVHSVDGTPIDSYTHVYDTLLGPAGALVLGADLDEDPHVDMQVAALLIFDRALDASEDAEVLYQLFERYGLPTPLDSNPVAVADSAVVDTGEGVVIDVLVNDTDDGNSLDASTVTVVTPAVHGTTFVDLATGQITYTHDGSVGASDTFEYTVEDGAGNVSNAGLVDITVNAVLNPIAVADTETVDISDVVLVDVLSNDIDVGYALDSSTVTVVTAAGSGTTDVDALTGVIAYTHDGSAGTADTFAYTVEDVDGNVSNVGLVSITIDDDANPVAVADSEAIDAGDVTIIDVLSNDTDDGNALDASTVTIVVAAGSGVTNVDAVTGDITYEHDGSTGTEDNFEYTVEDSGGNVSNAGLVSIVINVDASPVAVADSETVDSGDAVVINVLSNDTDDGNALNPSTVTVVTAASSGNAVVNIATGEVTYTHDGGASLADSFEYTVEDTGGNVSNAGVVSLTIDDDADPVAVADSEVIQVGGVVALDVLSNDTDDGDALDASTVVIVTAALSGTTSVDALTGVVTYTHDGSTGTTDTFEYTVQDAGGNESNVAIASITIDQDADPVAVNDVEVINAGDFVLIDVLSNDTDDGGLLDTTTVTVVTAAGSGTTNVDAVTGQITYAHDGGAGTADSFEYTVEDAGGNVSNSGLVSITINQNLQPVAEDDGGSVETGDVVVINVLANDSDDGNALDASTVTVVTDADFGSTSVNSVTGEITYTHDGSVGTLDSFEYTVEDLSGNISDAASVTVSVTEVFTLPTAGLVAHFDAGLGVSESAGFVTQWEDQSVEANDLAGFGSIMQIPNALNGETIVSLDGLNSYFTMSGPSGFPLGSTDRSVFYVVEYVMSNGAGISFGQDLANGSFGLNADPTIGTLTLDATGTENRFVTEVSGDGAGWILHGVVLQDDEFSHILNETSLVKQPHVFNSGAGDLVIGIDIGQSSFSEMRLAEIMIYDRSLTYAEQQQVFGHMRDKYDLENN